MAPSPQTQLSGQVGRLLPSGLADSTSVDAVNRMTKYRELFVQPLFTGLQPLAEEGSLFIASVAPGGTTSYQLGISATFSATLAAFVLANPTGSGKNAFPLALRLSQAVAPTSGTDLRYAIVLDAATRVPTTISNGAGGTGPGTPATNTAFRATALSPNTELSAHPVCLPYFPLSIAAGAAPTVPAATAAARTVVGAGFIKNSIPVVKDQYVLQFGAPHFNGTFQGAAALAKIVEPAPPVVVSPGFAMLIYLWSASNITAGNAWDDIELIWVER